VENSACGEKGEQKSHLMPCRVDKVAILVGAVMSWCPDALLLLGGSACPAAYSDIRREKHSWGSISPKWLSSQR